MSINIKLPVDRKQPIQVSKCLKKQTKLGKVTKISIQLPAIIIKIFPLSVGES